MTNGTAYPTPQDEGREGMTMLHCRDCSSYRPSSEGLGTCFIWSTPFGGDSRPVCGSFTPLIPEERDTQTIAGKFAEALGYIEDGICWLAQVNEQYDTKEQIAIRLKDVSGHHRFANPALDFWLQTENAEDVLKDMLRKLRGVAPLAPKEVRA